MSDLNSYPLLALVGQFEMKLALTLGLINPAIGGVLLSGPYGVGKTTAVRGLLDIMPTVERSRCRMACPLDAAEEELCAECRERLTAGEPRTIVDFMRLIELPLNARLEDVVGGINERIALEQQRVILEEGILARSHGNLLYIDEINLLDAGLLDMILDAAAQGRTFVRRGAMVRLFPSQFVLIGSMNPEEGRLRPQIMDRLGLRVWLPPVLEPSERSEIYRRAAAFQRDRVAFRAAYAAETATLRDEIDQARLLLPLVTVAPDAEELAIATITALAIPSHRAEIVLLEAARALAAAAGNTIATCDDVRMVAPLALRWRTSDHIAAFVAQQHTEDARILAALSNDPTSRNQS